MYPSKSTTTFSQTSALSFLHFQDAIYQNQKIQELIQAARVVFFQEWSKDPVASEPPEVLVKLQKPGHHLRPNELRVERAQECTLHELPPSHSSTALVENSWVSCVLTALTLTWRFNPWYWILLRRRQWHPTPVLLPRKSHGWRSLVGCSPWDR